ncbi:MAG: diacylglycerol/lipid kinase family protein [Eubacteriales bacterium]
MSEGKKLLFIVNPVAGKSAIKMHLLKVSEVFQQAGYDITLRVTLSESDAEAFAGDCAGYDRIICSGGDGTLSEVVNGVVASGQKVPIGYIPCGTTNDFADTLGLSSNIRKAAEFAALGDPVVCDAGQFNGKCFTYTAAFGLFSEVSYITPQSIKGVIGRAAYLLNGAESILEVKPQHMRVSCGGRVYEDEFLFGMISNSKSIGGFKGLGGLSVELSDGLFEAVFVKMPRNVQELQLVLKAFMQRELKEEYGVYSLKSDNVTVEAFGDTPWTLDGDYGGAPARAEISVLPGAVSYVANIDA